MVRNSSSRFLDVFGSSSSSTTTYTTTTTTSHGLVPPYVAHPTLLENNLKAQQHISPLALSPGRSQLQQSTRVQLQRQRLRDHAASSLLGNAIPGLKTSAAFFASLRTNLRLSTSPPPSPLSTPTSMSASASSLPPPSPLAQAVDDAAADPLAGVPELSSYQATTEEDKEDGLRLVADSVAQMRQTSNLILIWHPVNLGALVAVIATIGRIMAYTGKDIIAVGMAAVGLTMIYLIAFRYCTHGYLAAAEALSWEWVGDSDILVTKFGDEIIGALIVEFVSAEGRQKRKKTVRGEIRGWAVRKKYRNKGVGTALLEDAVKLAREKGAESLELADDHANSKHLLLSYYNDYWVKHEKKHRAKVQDLFDGSSRKRK